jgi:hypothetical protein
MTYGIDPDANPYYGQSEELNKKIEENPSYDPNIDGIVLVENEWKPDFNSTDPYAGMTPEYKEKAEAGFVPIEGTPEAPTTGIEPSPAPPVDTPTIITPTVQPTEQTTTSATIRGEYVQNIAVQNFGAGGSQVKIIGTPEVDLPRLQAAGASSAEIAIYMAKYGYDLQYSEQSGTDAEATKILASAGLIDPNTGKFDSSKISGTVFNNKILDYSTYVYLAEFGVTPASYYQIGEAKIPVLAWDNAKPEKQFNILQSAGQIPQDAVIVINSNGTWGYTTKEEKEKQELLEMLNRYSTISEAIRDGKIEDVRKAQSLGLLTEEQVISAQLSSADVVVRQDALNQLANYIDPDTKKLRLYEAIDGKIDASVIRNAGFDVSQDDYNLIKDELARQKESKPITIEEKTNTVENQANIVSTKPYSSMQQLNEAYRDAENRLSEFLLKEKLENSSLSKEERKKIIEQSSEYIDYLKIKKDLENPNIAKGGRQSAASDDLAELLSFGQIQTATYNRDELEKQYNNQINISTAVFKGDKDELKRLYEQGAFGDKKNALQAYSESLNIINKQQAVEDAVKQGNVKELETLYNAGYFGDDTKSFINLTEYVKQGGTELSPITAEDIAMVKQSYGTKEEYVQNVLSAQPTNIQLAAGIGTAMIPIYGTIKTWDSMNGAWRVGSIVLDVLTFIPLVGGIAAAAKVSAGVGRSARIVAGLKAIPQIAAAEVKAPFTALAHPLNTIKAAGGEIRNLGEWLLNPRHIPLNSATTSYGTVRLDVNVVGNPEGSMYVRDELMRLQSIGEKPIVIFAGKEYRLREPILMQGGGLVSASPDIKWTGVEGGATVTTKIYPDGHPKAGQRVIEREQGLFTSNAPLERFTSSSAFGLEKIGAGTLDDKVKLLTDTASKARAEGNIKLADKLENILNTAEEAKFSKDVNKIDKASASIVKQVDDLALQETYEAIYQAKVNANERMKIGDIAGAQEAMGEAIALENSIKPKVSGFAVFSPEVSVYSVPSEKMYPGMIFQPKPNEFWSILTNQVREDKAAQLLLKANDAKKVGDLEKAAQLSKEANEVINSGASGFRKVNTAEMEMKFPELFQLPEMKQTYSTRSGNQKLAIFTDKPYDSTMVVKSKLLAPIETIKQTFSPAISVRTIPMTDLDKLAQVDKLLKEADALDDWGEVTRAKIKRLEAETLRSGLSKTYTIEDAIKASTATDEVDDYTQAAQKAEALGDTVNSDRLIMEAERIRADRLAGRLYTDAVTGRAGTVMGVFENTRVLGVRPEGYERVQDVRVKDGRTTQTREGARIADTRELPARISETRLQDSRIPETRVQEERIPEARVPETRVPESRGAETRVPEPRIPEVRTPEIRIPDTRIPDTRTPEIRTPEIRVPDARIPETRVPEVRVPDVRIPEIRIPEVRTPEIRVPETGILPKPPEFDTDEVKRKKLKNGFITWRQGKTHWAIPQLEDGTFNTNDKVASGKPFYGTTKFAEGKGSVYNTMEYVGKNPPIKTDIDIGWAQFNVVGTPDGVKIKRIYPDKDANWEGVNAYNSPEALAAKRETQRLADIERYRRQYMKLPKQRKPKEQDVFKESDRLLADRPTKDEPQVITSGKRTYLGYEILPSQFGGNL